MREKETQIRHVQAQIANYKKDVYRMKMQIEASANEERFLFLEDQKKINKKLKEDRRKHIAVLEKRNREQLKILEKFGKGEDFDQKVRSLVEEVRNQKNLYKENDNERRRLDAERKKERHHMLKLEEEHKKLREKKIKI